jgi:TolA-binding protein
LDLALLDAYLAKWREAAESKDEAMSRQWQQKAVAVVRLIEQEHGPYWGRRGDLLLVRTAERGSGGADLEIMVRTADNFYLQKQYDEAIDAYDKAAQKALAAQDPKRAFELLYKAAAVAHLLKRHDAASRRLRDLAIKLPADTRAAEAHRLAAWNASQAVVQANDAALLPPYIALLEEHLEKFPDSPTCNQVRQWLGDIRKGQRQWSDALQAYLRVSPDSPYYASAVQSAAQCAAAWFEELKTQGVPYEEQAESAAANFEKLVAGGDGQLPAAWDDASRLAAVTAARIRLQHTSAGRAEAAKLLEAALAGSPEAPAAWKTDATALLVVALAAQEHRRQEAMQRLSDLADGEPKQLLEMLKGLATTADSASPQSRSQMAGLLLDAAGLLAPHRSELDDAGRYALARVEAEALAQLGRRDEAQAVYEALVREYPKDARVLRGYAGFLLQATDAASLSKALDQWRMLAAQPGTAHTDAWYEAKYSVALALSKLGRKDEAVQLIRYLQVTPPGLEKTSRRADFLRLLAECSAAK